VNRDGSLNFGLNVGLSSLAGMVEYPRGRLLSEVFYVNRTALLTRSSTFFDVGMFDSSLFLYRDDADYSWRLRLSGYKVAYVTNAKAYH